MRYGLRGLPGGSSLPQLLAERRRVRNPKQLPALQQKQILAWADAHYQRTGAWPTRKSGAVAEAEHGETWAAIDAEGTQEIMRRIASNRFFKSR